MSKLEDLIQKLCPNGVEWKELGELGKFENIGIDKTIKDTEQKVTILNYMDVYKNNYINTTIPKMIVSASEKKVKECTVEQWDVFITPTSEIKNDIGHAAVITENIYNCCYSYHIMRFRLFKPNRVTASFIMYLFQSINLQKQINKNSQGITRFGLTKTKFSYLKIPFPPLEIQEEIVHILDSFTELTNKLTNELTARRKQYEFYRDSLLTFGDEVEWKKLGEISEIGTGSSNTNEELENGKYPFFVRSQEVRYKDTYEYDEIAIITSGDGVGVGKIFHYIEGKYALHQRAYRIHINTHTVLPKYYFYYMKSTFLNYINKNAVNSSVTSIRRPMLNNYLVPLPPLSEQKRIVSMLDKFDSLCNDITKGLPAEIEARKKQYEYYRDKLLTFKDISENK